MNPSRRLFVADLTGSAVALVLAGCGGSDYSSPPPPPPTMPVPVPPPPPPTPALLCGATNISANHGHALVIPPADVDSTVDKVYSILGTADHNHLVTLTAAQLTQLKTGAAGTTITVGSTAGGDGHTHLVTVSCS
jgi:hypothetical protein